MPPLRIGGYVQLGAETLIFSGGGCLPANRNTVPSSHLAYRPRSDFRSLLKVAESCAMPLEEAKRIDIDSKGVTFTRWMTYVSRHVVAHGFDSIACVLQPKTKGASLPDINDLAACERECHEYNLFTHWGVLSNEDILAWDAALSTSQCFMDTDNSEYARKFLYDSVGPVLRERIDRELPPKVSGSRLLFYIIRKLQGVSSISGRQLVEELQQIKLTSFPGLHVQDCAHKVHNLCTRLVGLGASHVPSDLSMLVLQCFDHTGIQAFDLEKTKLECDLDDDPASHSWTDILDTLTSKFDKLYLTKRWPPLSSEKGQTTGVSAFAVQLAEVKKSLNDVKSVLGKQSASTKASLPTSGTTERDLSNIECNYCHKKGHYKSNCPTLAAKSSGTSTTSTSEAKPTGKAKHWSRVPPSDSDPHTKTVTTDDKSAVFKWCKHCRRWRSGPKSHLSEQHRKKNGDGPSGNSLQPASVASTGINFGLFTGASDPSMDPDFVTNFFASHSVDPTMSPEGAETPEGADSSPDPLTPAFAKAFVTEYSALDEAPTWSAALPTRPIPQGTGDAPPDWNFSVPRSVADRLSASKARLIADSRDNLPSSDDATDPKATAGQW